MKNFYKINAVFIILLLSSLSVWAQSIEHKNIAYGPLGNLLKAEPSEFLSEVIEIPIQNPEPFIAIGLTATLSNKTDNTKFYLRVSSDGNNWSDWQPVEDDNDATPSDNSFLGTLSFFEKDNKFMQFRTNAFSDLTELSFSFINPGKTDKNKIKNSIENTGTIKNISGIERPEYVLRKAWGCPQDENVSTRSLTNVTHVIIHHSAGNTVSSDYAAVVRAYWDYHVNTNGWADIGYNWLVDPNGVLYKGRAWQNSTQENVIGAHNSGHNSNTVGLCFIGNYVSNTPSDLGIDKLTSMTAFLCDKYGIDPEGESYHAAIGRVNDNITGHGQSGGGTSCPGTQLINRMQTIREVTSSKIIDITASPEIVATYPNAQIDSAYHSKKIFIEFSHPMNKASVENVFAISPSTFGTVSWNSEANTIYFEPSPALLKQTEYTITIDKSAKSEWDVPLSQNVEFSFVTKAHDNLSLLSTYPENNASDIELTPTITLQFDGPLNPSSLGGNVLFLDGDGNGVTFYVEPSGYADGIIKLTPTTDLDENSNYSIELHKGISTTDNYTFATDKTITFTTKTVTSVTQNNPKSYNLISAYPNPFNPSTTLEYHLENRSNVSITIYDVIGNKVKTLINKESNAGTYKITFNASNLPSGVYFSQIITNNETKTIKLLLTK